jgi:hypothetical protein
MRCKLFPLFVLFLCGCSVYSPKAPFPPSIFSEPYITDLSNPNLIPNYDSMPNGPAKIARRNQIVWEVIWLTDESYRKYEASFFTGQAYLSTAGDFSEIALSGAAAVTGTAHLKSVLAAVSGGIVGMGASYQKNFFDQTTRETIVQVMRASRLAKLVEMEQGMNSGPSYTIEWGLRDATDYYDNGTVMGALITISNSSSQKAAVAREALKAIRGLP